MDRPLLLFRRDPNTPSMCHFLSHMINMHRPDNHASNVIPKVTGGIESVDWLLEEMNWLDFWMRLPAVAKIFAVLFETDGDPPFSLPAL
jgi:hypothetical protein